MHDAARPTREGEAEPNLKVNRMLILTQRVGRTVTVGNVIVTVLGSHGNRVRLGFAGPREIPIVRQEVLEANHGDGKCGHKFD